MAVWNFIRHSFYQDSLTLMRVTHDLETLPGVRRVAVMMGIPANQALLRAAGLLSPPGDTAAPHDLIIAVEAETCAAAETCVATAEAAFMADRLAVASTTTVVPPRTLTAALPLLPGANLALISVPGMYAGREALQALQAGLHVMLFSDNVPLETEVALKRLALARGLLLMGPDCGTAIINGVPLGFANAVPRGRIGIAAASGTGLQEVACLLAAAGEGISQAIGVGGRDLSDEVGGLMLQHALTLLAADAETAVVCVIGKPPGSTTWSQIEAQLTRLGKPCVVYIGQDLPPRQAAWYAVATLEDAARIAVALVRGTSPGAQEPLAASEHFTHLVETETRAMHPGQRFVHGIYAGGTLAQEAHCLLQVSLEHVAPGVLGEGEGHRVVDLGADRFTTGRPHPLLDGSLRRTWIRQAAQDPTTAVLLLDIVLGYGVHPDPAGDLLPALRQARVEAQAQGRYLAIIASVCGTDQDPQGRTAQIAALQSHGVVVMPSNAQATRLAVRIAAAQGASGRPAQPGDTDSV
jgi:succinyl-CoA synthetase alpha subunit